MSCLCNAEEEMLDKGDDKDCSDKTFARLGQLRLQPRQRRGRGMKKPVTLDLSGLPWGSMKECLGDDIKKYAKNLDPTCNWETQPSPHREQLFWRLYKGMITKPLSSLASSTCRSHF